MKTKPIVIADGPNMQNLIIQINLEKGTTAIMSSKSAWENLAFIMEALKVTAEQCIAEGIDKKQVYDSINRYMAQLFASETLVWSPK